MPSHLFLDWMFTLISIFGIIYLPIQYEGYYTIYGILFYFLYPILLESCINLNSKLFYSDEEQTKRIKIMPSHPIIYHSQYNITACGIEKLHPFDSCKYGRIHQKIKYLVPQFHTPTMISRQLLLQLGLSKWYLFKMCYSAYLTQLVEVPIFFLPGAFTRQTLLNPMLYATSGTIDGICLALYFGWAINLSGGYHHAHLNGGGGFCIYPDISLAVNYLRKYKMKRKVMIIDLDAHQGNGYALDFLYDSEIYIVDFYNHQIYPNDHIAKQAIKCDIEVDGNTDDEKYCKILQNQLSLHLDIFRPEFIIYNAGTDCMIGDPLGQMQLTHKAIKIRDQIIFKQSKDRSIPILMVLSGGYQMDNASAIANSIINLIN